MKSNVDNLVMFDCSQIMTILHWSSITHYERHRQLIEQLIELDSITIASMYV